MDGKMENLKLTLENKVSSYDLKTNFQGLNDMLFVKFKQLEDTKTAVRDLIVFQKHFYPI